MPAAPTPSRFAAPRATPPDSGTRHRIDWAACSTLNVGVYLATALALLLVILRRTHGHFTYCLDDPYIHLALAERLRHGLYGINAGEPTSPSSSILWPLLLTPFAGTAVFAWMPLVLNVCFSTGTAWLLGRFVDRSFTPGWRARLLSILLLLATNIFGLTYTGLEHPLEVLLCLLCAFAVLHVLDGEAVPMAAIVAAALLPSVRYEGVLLTFVVAVALWATRRRAGALLLIPLSLVPAAVFGVFLHGLQLPWFPMSVLVKSSYKFQDHSILPVRVARLVAIAAYTTLKDPERVPELLVVCALGYMAWRNRRTRSVTLVLWACALAGAVQVLIGPVGWFFRYEMYCLAPTLLVAIAADIRMPAPGGPTESDLGSRSRPDLHLTSPYLRAETLAAARSVPGMLLVAVGALAFFYARPQLGVSQAALGIYEQQAQLGRFASEFYTGPVAVNDLGWVSYDRTPNRYVLDLVGLGSYEAFRTPPAQRTPAWLDRITREHGVGAVMLYPEWFHGLPASWTPMAKLCSVDVDPVLGAANARVMFYATPLADKAQMDEALMRFRQTLPTGTMLQLHPGDTSEVCNATP